MKTALAILLLCSASWADPPTRAELLQQVDALTSAANLYPVEGPPKLQLQTDLTTLRQHVELLPDPPLTIQDITVQPGETRVIGPGIVLVSNVHIRHGGILIHDRPTEVVWEDRPLDPADTEQMGRGLIVEGTIRANGTARTRRLRLEGPLVAGDTMIELQGDPIGWQVGDVLVLPDTRQKRMKAKIDPTSQSETVTVTAIAGRQVSITPAQFGHGSCALDPTLTPHVANVTCDIVFRSANPAGTRAHTICLAGATVDLSHCEFRDMGRTDKRRVINLTDNRKGRYPGPHLHEMGQTDARVEGCVVRGSLGWAFTVHGTHGAYIGHCVAYDGFGGAFVAEDGTEHDNLFADNIAIKWHNGRGANSGGSTGQDVRKITHTDGTPDFDIAFGGSGFWLRGCGNDLRGNVAADCEMMGISRNGYYNPIAKANVPPPGVDDSNEAYACGGGLWHTWQQVGAGKTTEWLPHTTSRFTGWHLTVFGLELWHTAKERVSDLRLLNDPRVSEKSEGAGSYLVRINTGFQPGGSYDCGDTTFNRVEIKGWNIGMRLPNNMAGGPRFAVADAVLENYVNVLAQQSSATRDATFERVQFVPSGMTRPAATSWATIPELDVLMTQRGTTIITERSAVRLLDTGETVYIIGDPNATCVTERERIRGYVCEDAP